MQSRSLAVDGHIFGLVMLFMGACTYVPPTPAPNDGAAGSGGVGGASPCLETQKVCNGFCINTLTDPLHCGGCNMACSTGFSCEAGMCQQLSPCTPGDMMGCYSGSPKTENVGLCKGGRKTCGADGLSWGPCEGEVLPGPEICGNIPDEDCDGIAPAGSACLVNKNLVVRYFLDEVVSGAATLALDSAPDPLDLPVTYDMTNSQPSYVADGTGRGLEWTVADQYGVASMPASGTKVRTMLEGKMKGTIELVARIDSATVNFNRLFTITTDSANVFGLGVYSTPMYSARLNSADIGQWSADFGNLGRAVYHLVLDTTDTNLSNRVRFYINGSLQTASGGTPPLDNTAFIFAGAESICLGNRDTQLRSMDGTLYYAALYADAMSDADIAINAELLKAWDDR